jgi:hypothetical protein
LAYKASLRLGQPAIVTSLNRDTRDLAYYIKTRRGRGRAFSQPDTICPRQDHIHTTVAIKAPCNFIINQDQTSGNRSLPTMEGTVLGKLHVSLCSHADDLTNAFLPPNPSPSSMDIVVVTPRQLAPTVGQLRVVAMTSAALSSLIFDAPIFPHPRCLTNPSCPWPPTPHCGPTPHQNSANPFDVGITLWVPTIGVLGLA